MSDKSVEELKMEKWIEEYEAFAETQEARDFCFGNYNNATRDDQVGQYCYLAAKKSDAQEIEELNWVAENLQKDLQTLRTQLESLKKENEELKKKTGFKTTIAYSECNNCGNRE